MKKIIKILIAVLLLSFTAKAFAASKKSIVCTTFPQYDWIKILLEKNQAPLSLLCF